MRIAEILQRIVAEWEIPCNKFLPTMEATWFQLSKQTTMKMTLLNLMVMNLIQIALHQKKAKNYFLINKMMSWIKWKGAISEVDNFDICEKDYQEAFVGWKSSDCSVHMLQSVVKVFQTALAYSRTIKCAFAVVK